MLPSSRVAWPCRLAFLSLLAAALPAFATTPGVPLEIRLTLHGDSMTWEAEAAVDLAIDAATWVSVPEAAVDPPPVLPTWMAAGTHREGRVACKRGIRWVELRLQVRDGSGVWPLAASAQRTSSASLRPLVIEARPLKPGQSAATTRVRGRIVYEDRLVDAGGYTGSVQLLPVRLVDAALLDAGSGVVLARSSVDNTGALEFALGSPPADPVVLELDASTHRQPAVRLAVLDPAAPTAEALARAEPHHVRSVPFAVDAAGTDLGTIVLRDPDGTGTVQAFHILDVALDAWDALASDDFAGIRPTAADSLRFVWGPLLPIRTTAYGGGTVDVASPGGGDTDGWSDAILLHEVGHFVAQRWLGDRNPGGIHLLGDLEQDLRLAWSEGWATAFSCWVRAHRSARHNLAGAPIDTDVASFVNAGLPPPDGIAGGLQYAWDVERNTLGGQPLVREGTGSETNVAAFLWDATDDASSADGQPGDDDATHVELAALWRAFARLRALQAPDGATFEDFFRGWQVEDPEGGALAALLRAADIEYVPDAAEPDEGVPSRLDPTRASAVAGGVVLSEIAPGPRIAVEIANRGSEPVDLAGWTLVARSNTSSTNPSLTFTMPADCLVGPGGRLVVRKGGLTRDDTAGDRFAPHWTVPWFPGIEGACMLFDAGGAPVDFVRWNSLDGTASSIAPPAGTGWTGELSAAPFGSSLARRADAVDADRAAEWGAAEPTLGAPNDARAVHRTFYPAGDVDAVRFAPAEDGVVSLQSRQLRSGAAPQLELWSPAGAHPLFVLPPDASRAGTAVLTLRVRAGETFEVRSRQSGATRFGSYDLALYFEPDDARRLPPRVVASTVDLAGDAGTVDLVWRNAARYDSLVVWTDSVAAVSLPGNADRWSTTLPRGQHTVEIEAFATGGAAPRVRLVIPVEPWKSTFSEPFDSLRTALWEWDGTWTAVPWAGRNGVLALSPSAPYPDNAVATLRLRSAIVPQPTTVLRFEHACIVRPEDRARLEISADWGQSWEVLGQWDWNAHRGDGEAPDWHDGRIDPTDWVPEELSLAGWSGRPVQIRWRFESDIYGRAAGWFVDALAVDASLPTPMPPFEVTFAANVPNPFNPTTTLPFEITQAARVRLAIYDVRGRRVRVLLDEVRAAGPQAVTWDGTDGSGRVVASGVYLAWLEARGELRSRRLVLVR